MTRPAHRPGRLLVVPQWQGSAAGDPRWVADGAHRLSALLPASRRTVVAVDPRPGRAEDGVRHLDVLAASLRATREALAGWGEEPLHTVGGDCGVELGPVSHAVARHGDDLAVVWCDAHADLNTPATSPSGGFHGMVLRTLLGHGPAALLPAPEERLSARRLVLAGVRALDAEERRFLTAARVPALPVAALDDPDRLVAAVAATGARHVYVHLGLDVLDPGHFTGLSCPEPGGLHPDRLADALTALAEGSLAGRRHRGPAGRRAPDQASSGRQAGPSPPGRTCPNTTSAKWMPKPMVSGSRSSATRRRRVSAASAGSWSGAADHSGWSTWIGECRASPKAISRRPPPARRAVRYVRHRGLAEPQRPEGGRSVQSLVLARCGSAHGRGPSGRPKGAELRERLLALLGAESPLARLTQAEQAALRSLLVRAMTHPREGKPPARG